jgi:hypothetical protein
MVGADAGEVLSTDGSRVAQPYEAGYGSLEIRASLDWLLARSVCGGSGGDPSPTPTPTGTATPTPTPTETIPSGEATTYYFHSATGLGTTDFALGGATFDKSAPTLAGASQAFDIPAIRNGTTGVGPWDPNWSGTVDDSFDAIEVRFWQRAPVGDFLGQVDYDIILTVGAGAEAARYTLPTLSETVEPTIGNATTEISELFTTMLDAQGNEVPLSVDAAGKPVTITIAGTFVVDEAGAWIDHDAVASPSGFTTYASGGSGQTTAETTTELTSASGTAGQYSDAVTLQARVSDLVSGQGVAGAEVLFELAGDQVSDSWTVTTDPNGLASREVVLDQDPGSYVLTVRFAGAEGVYSPSADVTGFVIDSDDSITTLQVQPTASGNKLVASLSDDDSSDGLAGRVVTFFDDDVRLGEAITDASGVATFVLSKKYKGYLEFDAVFGGDRFYRASRDRAESV